MAELALWYLIFEPTQAQRFFITVLGFGIEGPHLVIHLFQGPQSTKVPNWECESKRSWGVKLGLLVAEPTGVSEWKRRRDTESHPAAWTALVTLDERKVEHRFLVMWVTNAPE
ncbi:hypothetical protein FB451DRAFT_1182738 [Mycena latifolia]|nr:hypothetical protein FB451DRAFT_1182738 [Mycena latifolia]